MGMRGWRTWDELSPRSFEHVPETCALDRSAIRTVNERLQRNRRQNPRISGSDALKMGPSTSQEVWRELRPCRRGRRGFAPRRVHGGELLPCKRGQQALQRRVGRAHQSTYCARGGQERDGSSLCPRSADILYPSCCTLHCVGINASVCWALNVHCMPSQPIHERADRGHSFLTGLLHVPTLPSRQPRSLSTPG